MLKLRFTLPVLILVCAATGQLVADVGAVASHISAAQAAWEQDHTCQRGFDLIDDSCILCALGGHALGDRNNLAPHRNHPDRATPCVRAEGSSSRPAADRSQRRGPPLFLLSSLCDRPV